MLTDGNTLIGVQAKPQGLGLIQDTAREARAYHQLTPYPLYHFRDWKTETRGPLPRCLPIAKSIVGRGAKWLFGKAPTLVCPANTTLETFVQAAWKEEQLQSRLVAQAVNAGLDGGVALKFSYEPARANNPLVIQALSIVDECRLFYDPHDVQRLLMARVQYRYFDPVQGKHFWYREEWTDGLEVHYRPLPDDALGKNDPDTSADWQEESRTDNPFGLIPVHLVKNIETDDLYGAGDLWDLYRVLDRVHLTYHLMDKSNQFDSEPTTVFQDIDTDQQDLDQPLMPGQPLSVESKEGATGKVTVLETKGSLRPAMMEYAKELTKQVLDAASSSDLDPGDFTNKGNLTTAVLTQLYLPQIEATEEKRKTWGDSGLCLFFAKAARGLQHAGVALGVKDTDPDTCAVQIQWPAFFDPTEDEKTSLVTRTSKEIGAGFLTQERGVERVASANKIGDVAALKDELSNLPIPDQVAADQTADDNHQIAAQDAGAQEN